MCSNVVKPAQRCRVGAGYSMKFAIVSHAGLRVEPAGTSLMVDPCAVFDEVLRAG